MQEVRGEGSRVFVWPGVHAEAGENVHVLAPQARKAFVLTDRNCLEIARRVAMSLQQSGFQAAGCAVPPGRGRPAPAAARQVDERLGRLGVDATCIVAVGGTPVMHRGSSLASRYGGRVPLFLVPTSLRAQLDSSVGGASCCPIGGRWQDAVAVFSDPTVLATLPLRDFMAGLAEAVKCAMIASGELFEFLGKNEIAIRDRAPSTLEELVYLTANSKSSAVEAARGPSDALRALEYGHTVGRGLERMAGTAILHGEALAVGMEAEAAIARGLGWSDKEVGPSQNRLLKAFGLPTRVKGLPGDLLLKSLLGNGAGPEFILPDVIGHAHDRAPAPPALIKAAVAAITR